MNTLRKFRENKVSEFWGHIVAIISAISGSQFKDTGGIYSLHLTQRKKKNCHRPWMLSCGDVTCYGISLLYITTGFCWKLGRLRAFSHGKKLISDFRQNRSKDWQILPFKHFWMRKLLRIAFFKRVLIALLAVLHSRHRTFLRWS